MIQPVCPWCGEIMIPGEVKPTVYACVCPKCDAQGPTLRGFGSKTALCEKALLKALEGRPDNAHNRD